MEEERKHKKKVDFVNKTLATPFSQGKEVDFEPVKQKMVEFFEVLGNSNKHTIHYRKKLSQVMFS